MERAECLHANGLLNLCSHSKTCRAKKSAEPDEEDKRVFEVSSANNSIRMYRLHLMRQADSLRNSCERVMTNYNTIAETKNFIVLDRYQWDSVVNEEYQSEDALEREFIRDLEDQGYTYATEIRTPEAMLVNVQVQLEELNDVRFTEDEWKRFVEKYLDPGEREQHGQGPQDP